MKSIQSKILLVVIAGLLVITALVSAIAVNMTHEVMHRDADRILKNAAQSQAASINDILGDVVKSISIMEHYATEEIENANILKDTDARDKYIQTVDTMFTEVALNTSGVEGFYMRLDPEVSSGTSGFYKMLDSDGSLKYMPLTDLTKYKKDDKQNVGWYYEAVNAGKGVWLDPYYFPGDDSLLISFVQPLYVQRELIGVVGFDMDFSYLVKYIDEIRVYESGFAVLLAKDGVTVYNNIPDNDSTHNPHTESKVQLKNGMYLELRADYKDIQRDIYPMLTKIVLAFIVVLIASIVYTVIVTDRIVRPLKQLTASAEAISANPSSANLNEMLVKSNDEIGTLAQVLFNTYAKIQEYTSYINTLAYRDSLTGIKNSTAYTEAISEINKAILTDNPRFAVLVADINNLKQTNDKFGHDVGNELIIHTAKILTDTFKNSSVYRIGGDEFAVLLKNTDYLNYRSLLQKLDEACSNDFISVMDDTIPVSLARGVATYNPEIDKIYEDVFAKADHIMYMNKEEQHKATV